MVNTKINLSNLDYWDANWLNCTCYFKIDEKHIKDSFQIFITDVHILKEKIEQLSKGLTLSASFQTMEEDLNIQIVKEELYKVIVVYKIGIEYFSFEKNIHQNDIKDWLYRLNEIINENPIIGLP